MSTSKIVLIIIGLCVAFFGMLAIVSCQADKKTSLKFPVVNEISETAKSLEPWVIEKVSITGEATNYYYRKGDSTRYIQAVRDKVTIDHVYKKSKGDTLQVSTGY